MQKVLYTKLYFVQKNDGFLCRLEKLRQNLYIQELE